MLLIASIAALTAFCGCGEQKETGAKGSSDAQQTEASQEARKESTQAESSGQQESAGQESSAVRESSASQQESTDEEELFDKDLYVIVLDEEGQTTLDAYSGSGTVLYHYSDVQ